MPKAPSTLKQDKSPALDSSDDESAGSEDEQGIDVSTLKPAVDERTRKRLQRANAPNEKAGVVYLGRIPRGFYEDQMRAYFKQFGDVSRLRLARNRKTGASKHYAFIEFESRAVADIVAETMQNYLLLGHLLQCHVLEESQIHSNMWIGANRKFRPYPAVRVAREQCNSVKDADAQEKIAKRLRKAEAEKRKRIAASGIDYEFAGHSVKA